MTGSASGSAAKPSGGPRDLPILIAGGGIGGLACALVLSRQGYQVKVL